MLTLPDARGLGDAYAPPALAGSLSASKVALRHGDEDNRLPPTNNRDARANRHVEISTFTPAYAPLDPRLWIFMTSLPTGRDWFAIVWMHAGCTMAVSTKICAISGDSSWRDGWRTVPKPVPRTVNGVGDQAPTALLPRSKRLSSLPGRSREYGAALLSAH